MGYTNYGSMFSGEDSPNSVTWLAGTIQDGVTECDEEYWQGNGGVGGTTAYFQIQAILGELGFSGSNYATGGVAGTFDTLRDRLNAMGGSGGSGYLPRDGSLPMTGHLETGSNYIGIGFTSDPLYHLHIEASRASNPLMFLQNDSATGHGAYISAGGGSSYYSFWVQDYSQSTTFLYVRGDGNVSIGNSTSPTSKLYVAGTFAVTSSSTFSGQVTINQASSQSTLQIGNGGSYNNVISFNGTQDWYVGVNASDSDSFYISSANSFISPKLVITTSGAITVNNAYTLPASDGSNGYVLTTDGSGNVTWTSKTSGSVTGSGTTNYVPKWSSSSALTDSVIYATSGNVGIGTSSPVSKFEVVDNGMSSGSVARLSADDANVYGLVVANNTFSTSELNGLQLFTNNSGYGWIRTTSNSYPLILQSHGGNVGIGTSSPSNILTIDIGSGNTNSIWFGEVSTPAVVLTDISSTGVNGRISVYSGGVENIRLEALSSNDSYINAGNVGICTSNVQRKLTMLQGGSSFTLPAQSSLGSGNNKMALLGTEPQIYLSSDMNGSAVQSGAETNLMGMTISWYGYMAPTIFFGGNNLYFKYATPNSASGGVSDFGVITTSGNFGWGTTNPSGQLEVNTTSSYALLLDWSGTSTYYFAQTVLYFNNAGGSTINNQSGDLILSASNAEVMRLQSGKVGIGTSSPSSYYANGDDLVIYRGAGHVGITLACTTSQIGGLYFADGTTGSQAYRGYLTYDHSTDTLVFGASGINIGRFTSTYFDPYPYNNTIDFGQSSFRWKTIYGVDGSFSDDVYVGGTGSPSSTLHIYDGSSGTSAGIRLENNSGSDWGMGELVFNNTFSIYDFGASDGRFNIDSNGQVGIGTQTPVQRLHVAKNAPSLFEFVGQFENSKTNTTSASHVLALSYSGVSPNVASHYFLFMSDSTTTRAYIDSRGAYYGNGTYGTVSDRRLKTDIKVARSYWNDFKSLQYKNYRMINDKNGYRLFGLIAQDVIKVFGGLVDFRSDGYMGIKSSIIHDIGMSVVIESQGRIETNEQKIARLEARVEELELKLAA